MAMESPMVSMAPMRVTKMNAGSNAQKEAPNEKSSPGHPAGMPIQPAFLTDSKSKIPARAPTVEPTTTPMIGAQSRTDAPSPQREPGENGQGRPGAEERRQGRSALGDITQHREEDGHHRGRDQHDDDPGDRRSDHAAQPGEPEGEPELEQGGNEDQDREQRRTSFPERGDRNRDEGAGSSHEQNMPGAEPADAVRLQDGGKAAHGERREDRPGEIRLAEPGGADHDGGGEDDARDLQDRHLEAEPEGERLRGPFVRLVADGGFRAAAPGSRTGGTCVCHEEPPSAACGQSDVSAETGEAPG